MERVYPLRSESGAAYANPWGVLPRSQWLAVGVLPGPRRDVLRRAQSSAARMAGTRRSEDLNIEVLDAERVVLDELAARLDFVAHQHAEQLFGLHGVVYAHLQQHARVGVHGGLPQRV